MRAQMYQQAPTMAIASAMKLHSNYTVLMSSFYSDGNESDNQFDFSINSELLLAPNDIVIGEMIVDGGSFIIYKGLLKNEVPVAVKIVGPSRTTAVSVEDKEKFQKEVLLLSTMKHNNIVKFFGASIEPKLMIVTELLGGMTLRRFLWESRPIPLDMKTSLMFALDIARGMEFLHSNGIIHCDLNPRNMMVTGDLKQVKLADFGFAREETTDGMACEAGTYRWMAPEVFSREPLRRGEKKHYDHKVDVYSFALVFWELLTHKTPFSGIIPHISIPYFVGKGERPSLSNIPDEAVPIIESCWAEDPNARPEFKEITVLLKKLLSSLCSADTSSDTTLSKEEASEDAIEDPESTFQIQERSCKVKKPKEKKKKKKVVNMILSCFKMCKSLLWKP